MVYSPRHQTAILRLVLVTVLGQAQGTTEDGRPKKNSK
jgi:hypothetical protein